MKLIPARNKREFRALMKSDPKIVKFIRSHADWERYAKGAGKKGHLLTTLTSKEINLFTKSLVFRNGGLATANYRIVALKLSYARFRALWGRFGIDMLYLEDHKGYRCRGPGDCVQDSSCICTDNC